MSGGMVILKGKDNFPAWDDWLKRDFSEQGILDFLEMTPEEHLRDRMDGKSTEEQKLAEMDNFELDVSNARVTLLDSLSSDIRSLALPVLAYGHPRDIYNVLRERYETNRGARQADSWATVWGMKCPHQDTPLDTVNSIRRAFEELSSQMATSRVTAPELMEQICGLAVAHSLPPILAPTAQRIYDKELSHDQIVPAIEAAWRSLSRTELWQDRTVRPATPASESSSSQPSRNPKKRRREGPLAPNDKPFRGRLHNEYCYRCDHYGHLPTECKHPTMVLMDGGGIPVPAIDVFPSMPSKGFGDFISAAAAKDAVRVLLATINFKDMECHKVKLKAPFVDDTVDKKPPAEKPNSGEAADSSLAGLKKAIEDLKKPLRVVDGVLDFWLKSEGLVPTTTDPAVYVKKHDKDFLYVAIYDEQLIACTSLGMMVEFKGRLRDRFQYEDCGPPTDFLGLKVYRDRPGKYLYISQEEYLDQLLACFDMTGCEKAGTPLPQGFRPRAASHQEFLIAQHLDYPTLVRAISYAAGISRIDLSLAAELLGRYVGQWSETHYNAAKHCLQYIRGSINLSLRFNGAIEYFNASVDSTHADCLDTDRSTTGYVFEMCGGTVLWGSRRQQSVVRHQWQSRLAAIADIIPKVYWLRQFTHELGISDSTRNPSPLDPITVSAGSRVAADVAIFGPNSRHRIKVVGAIAALRHASDQDRVQIHPDEPIIAAIVTWKMTESRLGELNAVVGMLPHPINQAWDMESSSIAEDMWMLHGM